MLTRQRLCVALMVASTNAYAQAEEPATPAAPATPATPTTPPTPPATPATTTGDGTANGGLGVGGYTTVEQPAKPADDNPDAKGKFNAGGALAFPSGPDANDKYATFNWVKLTAQGRYNLLDFARVYLNVPLAVKHPDLPSPEPSPSMFGGFTARGEIGAKVAGLQVSAGYMKEQSFFYSDKMFPAYVGDYTPCLSVGPYINIKHWGLYFATAPALAYQGAGSLKRADGSSDGGAAIQLPLSAAVHLGSLLELAADTGLYTGSGLSFDAKDNASIFAGASITVKVKPVAVHLGTGVASLLTDAMAPYHSIGDSVYFDFNVKYVK